MNHSQTRRILAALQAGDTLTPMDALSRFNCFRLGARIADLKDGKLNHTKYDIQTDMVRNAEGKRFARYSLKTPRLRIIEAIDPYKPPTPPQAVQNNQSLFA